MHRQWLTLARDVGDREGEAKTLFNAGLALRDVGDPAKAISHAESALKILRQIGSPETAAVEEHLSHWLTRGAKVRRGRERRGDS